MTRHYEIKVTNGVASRWEPAFRTITEAVMETASWAYVEDAPKSVGFVSGVASDGVRVYAITASDYGVEIGFDGKYFEEFHDAVKRFDDWWDEDWDTDTKDIDMKDYED